MCKVYRVASRRHCGALEQESQTTIKSYPGERKSDCTTGQHKSSNQHTKGGGAEQQPDNAESDVQSPDFVTAGGVSTKKKRSSNRIWLQDSPEKGLMTGGRFCILTVDIAKPWSRRVNQQKNFWPRKRKFYIGKRTETDRSESGRLA